MIRSLSGSEFHDSIPLRLRFHDSIPLGLSISSFLLFSGIRIHASVPLRLSISRFLSLIYLCNLKLSSSLMAITSPNNIPHQWTYDVFVSFRGEDIRKSFIDHLFSDFKRKGIIAFRDDDTDHLPRGEGISSQLYTSIENSRFLIVIFSKNYASSSWCLTELVKILECKEMVNRDYQLLPVFYDVKPSVVRNQTESYAEAFALHESLKKKQVHKWKEALTMAASLSGWDLHDMANGYESKFIEIISNHIHQKLCNGPLHDVGENLVGVDERVNKMNLLRFVEPTKVHMIGICGIGGIGKTTLAKVIYKLMHVYFEACSFREDVQGVVKLRGLVQVQKQLINDFIKSKDLRLSSVSQGIKVIKRLLASKRVLIVLDNIDQRDQLDALAGSSSWFSPGSMIVFTSRDKQLLNAHQVDEIFHIDYLDKDEAIKLFSLSAFKREHPIEDFKELADQVVQTVQGHPLGLKVLGSFLYKKTVSEWKSEINRLQVYPNADIQRVLRSSFDSLDPDQQQIFLDIACSLKGENKDLASNVINSCGLFADTNIRVLVDKSLITISSTMSLEMHDLLQRMAWEIVRDESKKPGKRSRLWNREEVSDVLKKDKVTDAVEVLVLLLDKSSEKVVINSKSFARMNNLRILKICDLEPEYIGGMLDLKIDFSGSIDSLSDELRLLYWHRCPFQLLPTSFYPKNIVAIDMSYSKVKNLWTTPKEFKHLKVMNLRHCVHLAKTPDFTNITNLQDLNLEGCIRLVQVHPSVWNLKRLIILNLRNCRSLIGNVPQNIEMESLQILIISGCLKVDKLPDAIGTLKTLVEFHIDGTSIRQIPSFVWCLTNLQVLSVAGCGPTQSRWWTSILRGPSSLMKKHDPPPCLVLPSCSGLRLLKHLDVSRCNISEISPDSISGVSCLEYLNLSGNNFISLPENLSQFPRLTTLGLVGCKNLEVLPQLPPTIARFDAVDCTSLRQVQKQPFTFNSGSRALDFTNCPKLVEHQAIESLVSMMLPQSSDYLVNRLHICLQGRQLQTPHWFMDQSTGNCVTVKLPLRWCDNKFTRYGTCVIFKVKNPYIDGNILLQYHVANSDGASLDEAFVYYGTKLSDDEIKSDGSDMMWLLYSKLKPSLTEVNTSITVSFTSNNNDVEVKECGVTLVCDKDIPQELSGSSIPPTEEDGVVFHEQISEIIEPPFDKNRAV